MIEKRLKISLFIAVAISMLFVPTAAGNAPPRLEVMIEKTLWLTPTQSVTATEGNTYAIIYWEEPTNSNSSSVHSVYRLDVKETSATRIPLGKGSRVSAANAKEYEKNYIGYYRYPATHTAAELVNYEKYTYLIGTSEPYQEARLYPPRPNAHTNYQKNSDTCSGCHRTHYAEHPMLLSRKIMQQMCLECHDGSKSSYDVLRGLAMTSSGQVASPAGPFGTKDNPSTSFHNVFKEDAFDTPYADQFLLYAPGSGNELFNLTCTNCHSAHVTTSSSRYRFLKFAESKPVQAYSFISGGQYKVLYQDGMNQFCGQCHSEYNYGSATNPQNYPEHTLRADDGTGIKKSGDYYRHPTGIDITNWPGTGKTTLPVEHRDARKYMTCGTCHVAHGTAIKNSEQYSPELNNPALGQDPYKRDYDGNPIVDVDEKGIEKTYSSMLKRRIGMGICLECHLDQVWGNTPGGSLGQ